MSVDQQPIIRGIQTVGAVQILYRYNKLKEGSTTEYELPMPRDLIAINARADVKAIPIPAAGIPVAGFRLDSEFLRANPQIASAFVTPILGGGGAALTNNNRTGTLNIVCTKVAAPDINAEAAAAGKMIGGTDSALGVLSSGNYYDMVTLAQIQQAQPGGDSYGARLDIKFSFCGVDCIVRFEGVTIASVDPLGLAGNDLPNYAIAMPYLNWRMDYTGTVLQ